VITDKVIANKGVSSQR